MSARCRAEILERLHTLRAANDDALEALRGVADEHHRRALHQLEYAGRHIAGALAALEVER